MLRKFIPNQHGAWSMLTIPFLCGMLAAQPRMIHLLLFSCWLLAYLLAFPLLQGLRKGRMRTYKSPILLYSVLLIPMAAVLLWLRPQLVWYGVVLLPLMLVNAIYAKRNQERAFWNDMAAVVQFSSMAVPAYWLGGGDDWRLAVGLALACALYYIGTVFYVKTIIREKNNPTFYVASLGYHGVVLGLSCWLAPLWLAVPASVLLIRAAIGPKTGLSVKQVGMVEIAMSIMVLISIHQAWA